MGKPQYNAKTAPIQLDPINIIKGLSENAQNFNQTVRNNSRTQDVGGKNSSSVESGQIDNKQATELLTKLISSYSAQSPEQQRKTAVASVLKQAYEDPMVKSGLKELQKIQSTQLKEAAMSGVPQEQLEAQLVQKGIERTQLQQQAIEAAANPPQQQSNVPQEQVQRRGPNALQRFGLGFLAAAAPEYFKQVTGATNMEYQQELRRQRQQERLAIQDFGRVVSPKDFEKVGEMIGVSPVDMVKTGKAVEERDKNGNVKGIRILDEETFRNKVKQARVSPKDAEGIRDRIELLRAFDSVKKDLADIGITSKEDLNGVLQIETENVNNPFFKDVGFLSLPARFKSVRELSGDPERMRKLAKINSKLEQAFQKYRKIITGAQASNQELGTLRPLFPELTTRPETLFTIMDDIVKLNKVGIDDDLNYLESIGKDVTGLNDFYENSVKNIQIIGQENIPPANVQVDNQTGQEFFTTPSGIKYTLE